jgi:hypothetical protein
LNLVGVGGLLGLKSEPASRMAATAKHVSEGNMIYICIRGTDD